MVNTLRTNPVNKQIINAYSPAYYHARSLYFKARIDPDGRTVHLHSSAEIARFTAAEFNIRLPDSTVRRWSITPDKDFGGLTWSQKWDSLILKGSLNAAGAIPKPEEAFLSEKPEPDDSGDTPMQRLVKTREQSLKYDMDIAIGGDAIARLLMKEIADEYQRTKHVNLKKAGVFQVFWKSSKERMLKETETIKDLEKRVDAESAFGHLVPLKDAAARERVRTAIKKFISIAYIKGQEDAVSTQMHSEALTIKEKEDAERIMQSVSDSSDGSVAGEAGTENK